MKKSRFTESQIVAILNEADAPLGCASLKNHHCQDEKQECY